MSKNTSLRAESSPGKDRRKLTRVEVSITGRWGLTPQCSYEGTVTSLSLKGCLVQTRIAAPLAGKSISLCLWLKDGKRMRLKGRTIYYVRNNGFGMEFEELTEEDQAMLEMLIEQHSTEGGEK